MSFSTDLKSELLELKMWENNSQLTQDEQLARLCIREEFIKSGFINDPNKDYHLEILFKSIKKAEKINEILNNLGINSRITKKGNGNIVYLKDGEEISNFLALIGANSSVIKFEEIRVLKDTRNNINRLVNCETANLDKTITASAVQIDNINFLKDINEFEKLPENLRKIANLRIENPDATYEELGKMLEKPIGKSGVSHRLDKINQIAEEKK